MTKKRDTTEFHGGRMERYCGLMDVDKLQNLRVAVVGVGAIGRKATLMLAEMGVRDFVLIDGDEVSEVNMGVQGYRPDQVGMLKVSAMCDDLDAIFGDDGGDPGGECYPLRLLADNDESPDQIDACLAIRDADVVMLCVDCMDARKLVVDVAMAESGADAPPLVIEARMNALSCEVRSIYDDESLAAWRAAWYPPSVAKRQVNDDPDNIDGGCTTKSTLFCATGAATFMVSLVCQWIREFDLIHRVDYLFDSWIMTTMSAASALEEAKAKEPVAAA